MTLTDFLGVWGAILSTGAIVWNIIRDLLDRADVRLSVMLGYPVPRAGTGQLAAFKSATSREEATHFIVTITNHGRRAALVTKLCIKRPNTRGVSVIVPWTLPKLLRENEYTHELTEDLTAVTRGVERVFVVDSTGREWDLHRKQLRQLRDSVERLGLMSGWPFDLPRGEAPPAR